MSLRSSITTVFTACVLFFSYPAGCAFSAPGDFQVLKDWAEERQPSSKINKNIKNSSSYTQHTDTESSLDFSPSFDCTKASTSIELAICSDEELTVLDYFMSHIYESSRSENKNKDNILEQQRRWLSSREQLCGNMKNEELKQCLTMQYYSRINELLTLSPEYMKKNYSCDDVLNFTEMMVYSGYDEESEQYIQFISDFLRLVSNDLFSEQDLEDIFDSALGENPDPEEELGLRLFRECSRICGGYGTFSKKLLDLLDNARENMR